MIVIFIIVVIHLIPQITKAIAVGKLPQTYYQTYIDAFSQEHDVRVYTDSTGSTPETMTLRTIHGL